MRLVPMSPGYFDAFVERLIDEYAEDKIRAGNWPVDGARERARAEISGLLPQGIDTANQALFELAEPGEDEPVGVLWLAAINDAGVRKGFVYDLWIRPDLRRRGLGRQAMLKAEAWAKLEGLESISLHVFGDNAAAQALYLGLGYRITNISMTKILA